MRGGVVVSAVCLLALSSAARGEAALRGLAVDGNTCWAVGDRGTVLVSRDAARSWQRLHPPLAAHFQAVAAGPKGVFLLGGLGVPGHPAGRGLGIVLKTSDGGRSFRQVPSPPAGWLYGGAFAGRTGVAYGQATYAAPGGICHTNTAGEYWHAASVYTRGFILAGDFRTPRYAYLAGQNYRIVSLRGLAEPRVHPPAIPSRLSLRAVRFADEDVCWAAGDNGALFRARPAGRPWDPLPLDLPAGVRRCADLEAIAFASKRRAWLAGGLLGAVPYTETAAGSWTLRPAPSGGALHALAFLPPNGLLAAGDGERIWRSDDDGKTWQLVHGAVRTGVLFIAAAGDTSVYPAMTAHAMAGDSVAVVYATRLAHLPGTPPDQALRAAAATAGAGGVLALTEFPSVSASPADANLPEDEILRRWSARLDVPAEGEMVRQLSAAIRLYRPLVLAVGPDGAGRRGPAAENRLVSRLAQRAAVLAARADALRDLARAHLAPHAVRRVFVGLETNDAWSPPWQDPPRIDRRRVAVGFDGTRFPGGGKMPLSLHAQAAVWRLPGTGLLDRPAGYTAYRCRALAQPVRLFTTGLTDGRLSLPHGEPVERALSTMALLMMAIAHRQTYTAAIDLTATLDKAAAPEAAALAADRLLLAWWRLLDEGQLIQADRTLSAFLKKGRHHPLNQKINVLALATLCSSEWWAQARARGLPQGVKPATRRRAVEGFAALPAWCQSPAGRMLHAKALAATGQNPKARAVLVKLAGRGYPLRWRQCAQLELADVMPSREVLEGRRHTAAAFVAERGKLDGRLDETCWQTARAVPLLPFGPAPRAGARPLAGTLQIVRTAGGFVIFAVRLPAAPGRRWDVDVAVDADRDTWTQIVLHCGTSGDGSASLRFRGGPAANLGARTFQVQRHKTDTECTFEIAAALNQFAVRPPTADVWNFQLRATAHDLRGAATLYYQPQPDRRLLPERYGLLRVPGGVEPAPKDRTTPGRPVRKPLPVDRRFVR